MSKCARCGGKGTIDCPKCDGVGKVDKTTYIPILSEAVSLVDSDFTAQKECGKCGGTGEVACPACGGSGEV